MPKDKLRRLSALLPLVMSMSGGLVSPASALELSATNLASRIADALEQRHLPIAQVAVNQLLACNVRALLVNGVEYSMSDLTAMINRLATGQDAPLLPRPTGAAVFLVEPGGQAAEGVNCSAPPETQALSGDGVAIFPVGSAGA